MISLTIIFVLGLTLHQGQCQMSMAALAGMGGLRGMGGMGGMGLLGLGGMTGLEPNELMGLMAMSGGGAGGSGSGGSGSGAGSGSGGGMDPTMLYLMSQGGMGLGNMGEMLPMMMMMGNNNNQGNQQQPQVLANPIAKEILRFVGDSGSGISPATQNSLWHLVSMHKKQSKLFDAAANPDTQAQLEVSGLIAGLDPFITMSSCPVMTMDKCPPAFCETREVPHTPESFYICKGCPRCPLDASQRKLMNMLKMMNPRATKRDMNEMASQISMMKALQASGAGKNPMVMAHVMKSMKQHQQKRMQRQEKKKAMLKKPKVVKIKKDPTPAAAGGKPVMIPAQAAYMPGRLPMVPANMQVIPPPGWMVPGQMIQLQPGPGGVPNMVLAGPAMPPTAALKIPTKPSKIVTAGKKPTVNPEAAAEVPAETSYPTGEPTEVVEPAPTSGAGAQPPKPKQSSKFALDTSFPQPPAEFVAAMKRMRAKMEAQRQAMKAGGNAANTKQV